MGNKQIPEVKKIIVREELVEEKEKRLKSKMNGKYYNGNYVWGGAMDLCWAQLRNNIIKEQIKLNVEQELAKKMQHNFNHTLFSIKDLTEQSYYIKSGYGQQTVNKINEECKKKFPQKSFGKLTISLNPKDIISYAYFVKNVQYLNPFSPLQKFNFKGEIVKGFQGNKKLIWQNIRICQYNGYNQFIIKLKLKQMNEELLIVKGFQNSLPQQISDKIQQVCHVEEQPHYVKQFKMPCINLDIQRDYSEFIQHAFLNKQFVDYEITVMFEKIKFMINEVGAKVQNEAVIATTLKCCMPVQREPQRYLILDDSFWIIMKQKGSNPYFIIQINNTQYIVKQPIKTIPQPRFMCF